MSDFLAPIARTFADVLSPLQYSLESPEEIELFLTSHGWDASVNLANADAIRGAFAMIDLVQAVLDKLDVLISGTDEARSDAVAELIRTSKAVIDRMDALGGVATGGLPAPFNQQAFWTQIASELLDELTISYLERRQPFFFALLHILGVIAFERATPAGAGRVPYMVKKMHWDRLPKVLAGPGDLFKELYNWDTAGVDFKHAEFIRAVERAVLAFNFAARTGPPRPSLGSLLNPAVVITRGVMEVEIPFVDGISSSDGSYWKIGAVLMPVPDPVGTDAAPKGILVNPLLDGELSVTLPFSEDIHLTLSGAFAASNTIRALIYPDRAALDSNIADAAFAARMTLLGQPAQPWLIIGSKEGARLELDGFLAEFGGEGQINDPEWLFSVGTGQETNKVRLVVKAGEGDGLVQKLIGEGFELEFGANLHWSSKHGMSFDGSAALEFAKTIHLELGPLTIETVYVKAKAASGGDLAVELGAGINGELGPLAIVIENIGIRVLLVPAAAGKRGAFGGLDVKLGFKPPNGVGLAIDVAGTVKGGGYLFFDTDKEEYAGALELVIVDVIAVKAIGLVTTRMPDGSKGFSLLIIITAEFGTGIQLGMGFTLLGVGGLLGLNRMVRLQQLADGVRTGAVNNIMFPTDVIKNAPRIISDLRAIFPVKEGTFLIGPLAKIGYGSPTLITLDLGVVVEIPGNIAILGVLRCKLPKEESPVLVIQVAFVGAWEFDKKRVWLFAGLFESRLLTFALDGEMGVLFAYGDDPNFVLSVGGFHPRFTAPPLPFPVPKRLAITILDGSNARVRVSSYFAVTTNTAQFGARAELYFSYSGLRLDGHLGFDALFQFSPFYFIIEMGGSMSLKVGGMGVFSIGIDMSLEGPTPWHARGRGEISFTFFSISASFDKTWGTEDSSTLPPIQVMPLLLREFALPQSWTAELPKGSKMLISARKLDVQRDGIVVHPIGALRVAQRAVPLGIKLDKVGNQRPSDFNKFTLTVTTPGLRKAGNAQELFAPGQCRDMSNSSKLSQKAFVHENAGISIAADDIRSSQAVKRSIRYEQVTVDTNFRQSTRPFTVFSGMLFNHFLRGNAAARSVLSARFQKEMAPFADTITVRDEGVAVAQTMDNRAYRQDAVFSSQAAAEDYLADTLAAHPELAGTLHIIPEFELNL